MKEWTITFVDQKGEKKDLSLHSELQPSVEEAARLIRSHLYPVMDRADLTDFEDRAESPTARWLKEQNGVAIITIAPVD